MCDFDLATIPSPSFHSQFPQSLLGTAGTVNLYLCMKYEQKRENALQIMNLAAYASKRLIASSIIS